MANRTKGTVIDTYNEIASGYESKGEIGKAMQSGIMGWNTLIQYVVYAMSFLSQLGLLIGGLMILYAGYLYGSTVFSGSNPTKAEREIILKDLKIQLDDAIKAREFEKAALIRDQIKEIS